MKKFRVEFEINETGIYDTYAELTEIDAESEEEALELAKDWLCEEAFQNNNWDAEEAHIELEKIRNMNYRVEEN